MSGAVEVHVVTPEREVWAGQAETVIARGVDGEVGILTGHAPMMVQLAIGPLRIQAERQPEIAWPTSIFMGNGPYKRKPPNTVRR